MTSATIDTARFAAHFGGAPVVEVSGRSYPVEVRYRPFGADEGDDRDQTQAIVDAVQELMREGPGDLLVFLSGEREIRDTADALARLDLAGVDLLPLYARLSAAEQHRVFAPHPGRRIVLATNVAETSLTVPGIVGVIDPGTARISRYNRRTKVQRLPIERISQASAAQRAGRCGRVAPGICIRLYSEEDFDGRPEFTEPEILRTNLASVILQMAALGLGDIAAFPFVEPPDARSIKDGHPAPRGARRDRPGSADVRSRPAHQARAPPGPDPRRPAPGPDDHRGGPATAWWASCSCWRPPCRSRTRGSGRRARRRPPPRTTAASPIPTPTSWPTSTSGATSAPSRRSWGRARSDGCAGASTSTTSASASGRTSTASSARSPSASASQVAPLAEEPDRVGIHRALLAGLLSQVGMLDPDGNEYRGAREARFVLAPGTGLGRRRPKWVMAAELVETNRLRARTVAQIEPGDIEQVAGHLVTRSYEEPWWDEARGEAMTTERVTPLRAARRHRPTGRRSTRSIRCGLGRCSCATPSWTATGTARGTRSCAPTRQRVADVVALEQRVRRDLLVGDDALVAFFDRADARTT